MLNRDKDNNTRDVGRSDTNDRIYSSSNLDSNGKPTVIKLFAIEMSRDTGYYLVDTLCLILLIAAFVIVGTSVEWDAYIWRFYVGFGCLMAFCIVVAEVNHHNKFASMTAYFHRWRYPLIVIFFVLALVDFVLLELSDVPEDCDFNDPVLKENCPLLNPDESGTISLRNCGFILLIVSFISTSTLLRSSICYKIFNHCLWNIIFMCYDGILGAFLVFKCT